MRINKKTYIGMVFGGIVLLLVVPRDPWPSGMYIYLYFCSIIGSIVGHSFKKDFLKSFLLSVIAASFLFLLGIIILDICIKGISVTFEYIMWLPIMVFFTGLNGLAGTLTAFPIVGTLINRIKKTERA